MQNKSNVSRGISYIEALQLALVMLKLAKIINWKWCWVLFPTWGSILLTIICICLIILFTALSN